MLFVDDRAGSSDLINPLRTAGLPVESLRLDSGDIYFTGRGEGGAPVNIGLEHKSVSDLINSLNTERLQGFQMVRMLDTYDRNWLVIEGEWQHDEAGKVTTWKKPQGRRVIPGAPLAVELEKRLLTLEIRGGMRVRHCATRKDTIRFITGLYRWWTDCDLDAHKSHLALHAPDLDRQLRIPISLKREIAARLPGIGYERSGEVDRYFCSIREMINAPEDVWVKIAGIGKGIARKVVEAVSR
jgi:ERCC4-type nuclease